MGIKGVIKGMFKKPPPKEPSIYGKRDIFPGAELYRQQLRKRLGG